MRKATLCLLLSLGITSIAGAQPSFIGSSTQYGSVCQNSGTNDVSSFLSVSDMTATDTLNWYQAMGPANGVLTASFSDTGATGVITPSDITYMPNAGYNGTDEFVVAVNNGSAGDTVYDTIFVSVNALPAQYSVTGGNYCPAGTGAAINISNSDLSVSYAVYGATMADTMAGSGSAESLGMYAMGTYTVVAVNDTSGCQDTVGTAMVGTYTLPVAYTIMGGGNYCAGGTGVDLSLSGSDMSVTYQLTGAGTTASLSGNGSALDFGSDTGAGTYIVIATNDTSGCVDTMMGMDTITELALPSMYNLLGGGSYCASNVTSFDLSLSQSDASVSYILFSGASIVADLSGSGASLDFGSTSVPGTYYVVASNDTSSCTDTMSGQSIITSNANPNVYAVTGGGNYCSGAVGAAVGLNNSQFGVKYSLYHDGMPVGSAIAGNGTVNTFGYVTDSGTYYAFATDTTTADNCASTMSDTVHVGVLPLPALFTIIGGGAYCNGMTGPAVNLSGSESNVNYVLYLETTPVDTVAGSGTSITFGTQTSAGSYAAVAYNTVSGCLDNMTGSVPVSINPLPPMFILSGGGSLCAGSTGVDVSLNASLGAYTYQLYNNGSPIGSSVIGSGSAIDFGNQTIAGGYYVIAADISTSCYDTMTGMPLVVVNPLPIVSTVIGGGSYCPLDRGVFVNLDYSDTNYNYVAYCNDSAVTAPTRGTEDILHFGPEMAPGSYTAIATNPVTGCSDTMFGAATVTITPPPAMYVVTGGGNYCAGGVGVSLGLSGSDTGVVYQLSVGTSGLGSPLAGTGAALNFGLDTIAGVYTVFATDTNTTCTSSMLDSASVVINPLLSPMVHIATGLSDTLCAGTMVTFMADTSAGGSSPIIQWNVNGIASAFDSGSFSYVPSNGDKVSIEVTSSAPCLAYDTAVDTFGINIWPNQRPYVAIAIDNDTVCKGSAVNFSTMDTAAGTTPGYQWVVNGLNAGTGAAFSYVPVNGDIIYCTMNSSYKCRTTTAVNSNDIAVTVDSPIVPSLEISVTPGTYVSTGHPDTLTALVANGGTSPMYQWYFGAMEIPGATTGMYVNSDFYGRDSVSCQVTRQDACRLIGYNAVIIFGNGLGINSPSSSMALGMYPNPNDGMFTIKGNTGSLNDETLALSIIDITGQEVYNSAVVATGGKVNSSISLPQNLASGTYMLNLTGATGTTTIHFMVQK